MEAAVEAYGLKALPGSDGEIEVQEDVKDMAMGWKDETLTFTTTFSAIFDPEKVSSDSTTTDDDVIDVEIEEPAK